MRLTPDPIVAQLLSMKLSPVQNQPECPARKLSFNDFERLDPDFGLVLAVDRVEVRWRVIVIIHPNDNPEEDAECWHSISPRFRALIYSAARG
jgi:hypothetical protein